MHCIFRRVHRVGYGNRSSCQAGLQLLMMYRGRVSTVVGLHRGQSITMISLSYLATLSREGEACLPETVATSSSDPGDISRTT